MFLEPSLLGSLMYSLAVSVKMNILLYSPALLLVYLAVLGFRNTILQVSGFSPV
jgi:alpha-1,3-mannosyltransferase